MNTYKDQRCVEISAISLEKLLVMFIRECLVCIPKCCLLVSSRRRFRLQLVNEPEEPSLCTVSETNMYPYAPVGLLFLFFEKIGKTPLYCTDQPVPVAIRQLWARVTHEESRAPLVLGHGLDVCILEQRHGDRQLARGRRVTAVRFLVRSLFT